jgi:S-formylglutathione hydrolase FrmB
MKRSLITGVLASLGVIRLSRRLEVHWVDSRLLGRPMRFAILRPPPDDDDASDPEHVVYVLHGLGDDCLALDRHGVSDVLFHAMQVGRMPRANVIMPSGERGFYVDWYDGTHPYESHLVQEVLPAAETILGLEALPRGQRHLTGVSMGGIGALQIGLRHPDLFTSIGSLSGPVMNEEQAIAHLQQSFTRWFVDFKRVFGDGSDQEFMESHNPWAIVRRRAPDIGQRLYVAAGREEKPFFRETTSAFHAFLTDRGVDHGYELFDGRHGWRYWTPAMERAIRHGIGAAEG